MDVINTKGEETSIIDGQRDQVYRFNSISVTNT